MSDAICNIPTDEEVRAILAEVLDDERESTIGGTIVHVWSEQEKKLRAWIAAAAPK